MNQLVSYCDAQKAVQHDALLYDLAIAKKFLAKGVVGTDYQLFTSIYTITIKKTNLVCLQLLQHYSYNI